MTDDTSKSTANARMIEANATKKRIALQNSLGEPKRKFSETFRAVDAVIDHFLNRGKNKHGDHE